MGIVYTKYLPNERETTIRWSDDKTEGVRIFTSSPVVHRRLERRGLTSSKQTHQNGHIVGWFYAYPYNTLSLVLPRIKTPKKGPVSRPTGGV